MKLFLIFFFFLWPLHIHADSKIFLGVDRVFEDPYLEHIKGKRIGLITNQTGVNRQLVSTITLFRSKQKIYGFELRALFAPEHGLYGEGYANEKIASTKLDGKIPILSLHGTTKRPTPEMLQDIDVLVYDIQDIGSRPYTFASTLFYVMEEAAKKNITVIVLDRPNPINGIVVDGPLLDPEMRSFLGYINVPYCHGMTIGELALFFNEEYKVGCDLQVVPMKGWKRQMSFHETGLDWIPTSPNIPEATTALYYPITGILGEASVVSIGIGYTLPFKVVGAPWIKPERLITSLSQCKLPGVSFYPILFKPFFGKFAGKTCGGVLVIVNNTHTFLPVTTQFAIISSLKKLYPKEYAAAFTKMDKHTSTLTTRVCGTHKALALMQDKKATFTDLASFYQNDLKKFMKVRKKYLLPEYES